MNSNPCQKTNSPCRETNTTMSTSHHQIVAALDRVAIFPTELCQRRSQSPAGELGRSGVMKLSGEAARRNGRSIPSFFIRNINVVRFKPSCTAAPFGPPILQPVASSVWSMSARSESRSVFGAAGSVSLDIVVGGGEGAVGATGLGSGFGSTPSWARMTARSTRFCSSRMLPGQEYDEKAAIVSGGMWRMCLLMRPLKISTKCSTRAGISSRRSRRGGNEIGKTLSR